MKNNNLQLKQIFRESLAQPVTEAENEKQFQEFLQLLRDGFEARARRLGRRMIANHLKP